MAEALPGSRGTEEAAREAHLPSPAELRARLPRSARAACTVAEARAALRAVLRGEDARRLVAIVGPCSLHDREGALAYAARLRHVAARTRDALVVVMRAYVEKPRTGLGWKGLLPEPEPGGAPDPARGLALARDLLLEIADAGLPCASELVGAATPAYLEDALAWACVGARTAESPVHRELASALPLPVGLKNGTDGRVATALEARATAAAPQAFVAPDDAGRLAVRRSAGNPDAHVVLRGGRSGPDHAPESVARAAAALRREGLARGVLVDCAHGNSAKDPARQAAVCRELLGAHAARPGGLAGFLLESHLAPGRQEPRPGAPLARGLSLTDPCLGWAETEALLEEAAAAVRRGARGRPARAEPASRHGAC